MHALPVLLRGMGIGCDVMDWISAGAPGLTLATCIVVQIVGLANTMLSCYIRVDSLDDAIDIVGTGGDGADTVNISTGSTILAAAAGAKVAKVHHAFRGFRSSSSSSDAAQAGHADAGLCSSCSKGAGLARRRAAASMCLRRWGSTSTLDPRYCHILFSASIVYHE